MQGFCPASVCVCPALVCVSLFVSVFLNERAVLKPKWFTTNRSEAKYFEGRCVYVSALVCVSFFVSRRFKMGGQCAPERSVLEPKWFRTGGSEAKAFQNGRF